MAARDLAIYKKQILEGILESLYGRPGLGNLRKADPGGYLESLYGHQGFSDLRKAGPWGYFRVSI